MWSRNIQALAIFTTTLCLQCNCDCISGSCVSERCKQSKIDPHVFVVWLWTVNWFTNNFKSMLTYDNYVHRLNFEMFISRRSASSTLLELRVRISPGSWPRVSWEFVCCHALAQKSPTKWCVCVCVCVWCVCVWCVCVCDVWRVCVCVRARATNL